MQFYALSVLDLLDRINQIDRNDRELRLAMLASGRYEADVLFEELKVVVNDDSADLPQEADSEGNPVSTKYDFSNATYDPKAVEEEIREMLARAAQSETSFDELTYEEDWV